jgi:hypothetical protein
MLYMKQNVQEKINLLSLNNSLRRTVSIFSGLVCLIVLAGCARYGNPLGRTEADYSNLPTESLHTAALYIEQQVVEQNRTPDLSDKENFKLNSPAVQQALRSRAARAHLVKDMLDSGYLFENNNGRIEIIRTKAYKDSGDAKSRDRDALVVISENNDRRMMYESLQEINNLNPADRSAIEEIFFNARKELLVVGHLYEGSDGKPVSKI